MTRAMVTIAEQDLSGRVPSFPGITAGLVIPALKGEVNATSLVTTDTQLLERYTPNETIKVGYDFSYYSALSFLLKSNKIQISRSNNGGLYGGCYLVGDLPLDSVGITASDVNDCLYIKQITSDQIADAATFWAATTTAEKVQVASTISLPAPLMAATDYYLIKFDEEGKRVKLAATKEDAYSETFIDLTTTGTGDITLILAGSNVNGEVEYGMTNPQTYVMNSDDGKLAGSTSTFTIDLERDAFNVSQEFYDMVATGDECTLAATAFPTAETAPALDGVTTYNIIKVDPQTDLSYEIRLARDLADAGAGVYIPISDAGTDVVCTLSNKTDISNFTTDFNTDVITVDADFYAAVVNNDVVQLTTSAADLPDPLLIATDYYIIKSVTPNEIQLSLTSGGGAIDLTDDGTGTHTMTLQNKIASDTLEGDLSNDTITVSSSFMSWLVGNEKVQVASDTVLPSGLVASTDYYVFIADFDNNKIKLAQSVAALEIEQFIDINDGGTGTHTIYNLNNNELLGLEQKLLLIYGSNQGAWTDDIYIKTLHYPYGDSDTWTALQQVAAETVKEPDCFLIYVYQKQTEGNLLLIEDPWLCSRYINKKDGYGQNVYIENVLEGSKYIRAIDNTTIDESIYPQDQDQPLMLTQGDDGGTITDTHMLQAIEPFRNRRDIFITLMLDGGWATPSYQKQGIIDLCENRKDAFGILSVPYSDEVSADYINAILAYRKEELNASTSYAALYTSHLKIQDRFNDRQIYVPTDGYVGAAISQTAENYEIWFPPAGAKRGQLNVIDVRRRFTEGEMDILYDNGINPIDFYPGKGIRIWGQKTLLARPSALDRINVRLLLIVIEPAIAEFLEDFVFDFNDAPTRTLVSSGINSYMENIRSRRGVYAYQTVCDESNNTPEVIDANKMNVWLFVQPVKSSEYVKFLTIITRTGATFSIA